MIGLLTGGMVGVSTRAGLGSCSVVAGGESVEGAEGSGVEGEDGFDGASRGVVGGEDGRG